MLTMELPAEERKKHGWFNFEKTAYFFAVYCVGKYLVSLAMGLISFATGHPPITILNEDPHSEAIKNKMYPYIALGLYISGLFFTALLLVGLKKRKPSFLLTFYIYGVLVELLNLGSLAVFVIVRLVARSQFLPAGQFAIFLLFHVITIFGLTIVIKTYNKFIREGGSQCELTKLQEVNAV